MATADSVKSKINGLISKANDKTGKTDSTLTAAVDRLITGYGQGSGTGITPTGTIKITENGDYDVTSYAKAEVDVPESVESTGNIEADNLAELHYWEKYVSGSDRVTETSVSNVTLSYQSKVGTNPAFDTVKYSDGITVNGDALALIDPVTTILLDNTNRDQIVGKYIHTTYDGGYYRIPSDAKITYKTSTYSSSVIADKAFKLTAEAGGERLGVVVAANSAAYPEDGEQDGYRYVYMGTLSNTGGDDGTLPTLTNPGSATDLATGKQLIDGNGNIVTGSLFEVPAGNTLYGNNDPALSWRDDGKVETVSTYGVASSGDGGIIRPGAKFAIRTPAEQYGDATAADVAAGKTFTSAAGLKVIGTGTGAGGSGLVMMTGTTVSNVIDTGLSTIRAIVLYKESISATGLIQLTADLQNESVYYSYCSSVTDYVKNVIMAKGSALVAVDGGTITWNGSSTAALTADTEYNWIAVGTA